MNKVPDLRFAGFSGEWESTRLSDISIINPKSGKLPETFKYVDLASVTGTNLTNYTILKKEDAPSRAQRLSEKGDIFYQTVRPYQRNNYLFNLDDNNYVFSTGYAQIRTNQEPSFIFAIMQTNKFVNTVMNRTTGTSFPAISTTDLSDIDIKVTPIKEEQEKIGNLFKKIDALIEIQEGKISKIEDFKKSMIQKTFPKKGELIPEFRFDGFDGNWDVLTLGEIGDIQSSGVDKVIYNNQKIVRLLNYMDVYNKKSPTINNIETFMKTSASDKEMLTKDIMKGDILFTPTSETAEDIGHSMVIKDDIKGMVYSYHIFRFRPNRGVLDINFSNYFCNIEPVRKQLKINAQGAQRYTLKLNDFRDLNIIIPSLPEQEKIGQFFKNLDSQIETEKKLLDSYKMMKRSLLQKLFV